MSIWINRDIEVDITELNMSPRDTVEYLRSCGDIGMDGRFLELYFSNENWAYEEDLRELANNLPKKTIEFLKKLISLRKNKDEIS